jgi:hypothetical protein
VAVVAGLTEQQVVSGLAVELVVVVPAEQAVVVGAAEQAVVVVLADQGVVAGATFDVVVAGAAADDVVTCLADDRVVAAEAGDDVPARCADNPVVARRADLRGEPALAGDGRRRGVLGAGLACKPGAGDDSGETECDEHAVHGCGPFRVVVWVRRAWLAVPTRGACGGLGRGPVLRPGVLRFGGDPAGLIARQSASRRLQTAAIPLTRLLPPPWGRNVAASWRQSRRG